MSMKSADEIKKGLECCISDNCKECPYYPLYEVFGCKLARATDTLALIQQLQDDNAEKDKRIQELERSLSFARDLADGLKAATVKQEQELYVSVERNRQIEAQNAELSGKVRLLQDAVDQWELVAASPGAVEDMARENTELLKKVEQLQAERDAAVKDIRLAFTMHLGACNTCLYFEDRLACDAANICAICEDKECVCNNCDNDCSNWQWRGVQKEE